MELFVPGRLLLVGDHSDWVGQFKKNDPTVKDTHAIICGLNQGIYATVEKSEDFHFKMGNLEFRSDMNMTRLREIASLGNFFSYVAGTASYFTAYGGLDVTVTKMDLPMGKGLASSAAICVLIAKAFDLVYNLCMVEENFMYIAYLGETATPSKCGRGDQACAYGTKPVHIIFNGDDVHVCPLDVNGSFEFVIADLNGNKNTTIICSDLQKAFKSDSPAHSKAREFLMEDNTRIVAQAIQAISSGNKEMLGDAMNTSFKLFNEKMAPLSKEQLSAPKLHSILNDPRIQQYTYGGKGIGAQGDGSVQLLCKDKETQALLLDYLKRVYYMEGWCYTLTR